MLASDSDDKTALPVADGADQGAEAIERAIHGRCALKVAKYYCQSSGWADAFATFIRQHCKLFRCFDARAYHGIRAQDAEIGSEDVHLMMRSHLQFMALVDSAISKKIREETPEVSLEDFARILAGGAAPVAKDAAEVREHLLRHDDFASFGQFMRGEYERLCQTVIQIFHDGENCYFGNTPGLRVERLFEAAVEEIRRLADLPDQSPVHWRLYLGEPTPDRVRQHPSPKAVETLGVLGVEYIRVPCRKDGDVDTKLKDGIARFAREHRASPERHLVVVLSGDSDFQQNLQEVRAEGFRTMLLHGGQLKPGVAADCVSDAWFDLVAQAGGDVLPAPASTHAPRGPGPKAEMETLEFPLGYAGLIIGKGGSKIKELCERSGARLQLDTKDNCCKVRVEGTPGQIAAAKDMLQRVVEDVPSEEEMEVPPAMVGRIIGQRGEVVKQLQQESGCRIAIVGDRGVARLRGSAEAIAKARGMIEAIVVAEQAICEPAG